MTRRRSPQVPGQYGIDSLLEMSAEALDVRRTKLLEWFDQGLLTGARHQFGPDPIELDATSLTCLKAVELARHVGGLPNLLTAEDLMRAVRDGLHTFGGALFLTFEEGAGRVTARLFRASPESIREPDAVTNLSDLHRQFSETFYDEAKQ